MNLIKNIILSQIKLAQFILDTLIRFGYAHASNIMLGHFSAYLANYTNNMSLKQYKWLI